MSNYLVVHVLKPGSVEIPRTFRIGYVELRPPRCDSLKERELILDSLKNNDEEIDPNMGTRLCCIVEDCDSMKEAIDMAREKVEEAADLESLDNALGGGMTILDSGIVRDLETGRVRPIKVHKRDLGSSFRVNHYKYPPLTLKEFIAMRSDLPICNSMTRSLHWARKAHNEKGLQMKVLFNWFSLEALWKTSEDDDIVPKIMLCLGLPIGNSKNNVDPNLLSQLENIENYDAWKKIVLKTFRDIVSYRNGSVHSGFRPWDIDRQKLLKFGFLVRAAIATSHTNALSGISYGCENAKELWLNSPDLLSVKENLVNYLGGTFIFSLKNQTYLSAWGY